MMNQEAGFDPAKHPHVPGGSPEGGQFSSTGGKQTDSPAFKAWFGNSKVVDATGKPMVVYHGTGADIEQFNLRHNKTGASAYFFSEDPQFAAMYASKGSNPVVYPVYLRAERPFDNTDPSHFERLNNALSAVLDKESEKPWVHGVPQSRSFYPFTRGSVIEGVKQGKWHMIEQPLVMDALKLAKFDGAMVREGGARNYMVFRPTQIKSAIGNRGTFDPHNPKISESGTFRESDPTDDEDGDILELSHEMSAPTESVTLQIDAALDPTIWNGTTFEDRTTHLVSTSARDMVTQMERSLMQQESYDEFSKRMMKQMGIEDLSAKGVLRDMINQAKMEASVAWNEAMISANQQDDTVLVWEAILDDATTPVCWNNHGRLLDDVAESIPDHWGCRCTPKTIPNPDSTDPEWAAQGQSILDEMAAERDSGGA